MHRRPAPGAGDGPAEVLNCAHFQSDRAPGRPAQMQTVHTLIDGMPVTSELIERFERLDRGQDDAAPRLNADERALYDAWKALRARRTQAPAARARVKR